MPVTLDAVLARRELHLRLITASDTARGRAWGWVHSSDLDDPTPFLSPGDALLTTGTQWASDDEIAPWVGRLAAAGVPAVGFGTEVIRDGTPDALADACAHHGIALIEVPYRTPFIAVARAVADLDAEERYARVRWTLATQRAIAVAALKPAGLGAVIA
jgi:purine catabolism regulator